MFVFLKMIWITAVIVASVALLWFLFFLIFHRTAIGPAGPFILYFIWIPALLFVTASINLIAKGKMPNNLIAQIIFILFLIIFSIGFSGTLLRHPSF